MNAVRPRQRVGDDVERDEQPVVPDHRAAASDRTARRRALPSRRRSARGRSARRGGGWRRRRTRRARRVDRSPSANASVDGSSTSRPVSPGTTVSSAPPRAERDHRPAARLGLERDDAEVLLAGQQRRRRRGGTDRESPRPTGGRETCVGRVGAGARARPVRVRRRRSSAARRRARRRRSPARCACRAPAPTRPAHSAQAATPSGWKKPVSTGGYTTVASRL